MFPSNPILQRLTCKALAHDPKKRVTFIYVFNTLQSCMDNVTFSLSSCVLNYWCFIILYMFFTRNLFFFFFPICVFFHEHSRITGLQENGEGISLTPHQLHRHLDISWAITTESSPLHIASSRTRTGNLWFPSASR